MLGFILGTMTGGVMGVFAMCLFIAGKREDEALERCRMKRKEIIDPVSYTHLIVRKVLESAGYEADGIHMDALIHKQSPELSLIHICRCSLWRLQ